MFVMPTAYTKPSKKSVYCTNNPGRLERRACAAVFCKCNALENSAILVCSLVKQLLHIPSKLPCERAQGAKAE
jgi:hypothetical protein